VGLFKGILKSGFPETRKTNPSGDAFARPGRLLQRREPRRRFSMCQGTHTYNAFTTSSAKSAASSPTIAPSSGRHMLGFEDDGREVVAVFCLECADEFRNDDLDG
jgi:hypothetical protein